MEFKWKILILIVAIVAVVVVGGTLAYVIEGQQKQIQELSQEKLEQERQEQAQLALEQLERERAERKRMEQAALNLLEQRQLAQQEQLEQKRQKQHEQAMLKLELQNERRELPALLVGAQELLTQAQQLTLEKHRVAQVPWLERFRRETLERDLERVQVPLAQTQELVEQVQELQEQRQELLEQMLEELDQEQVQKLIQERERLKLKHEELKQELLKQTELLLRVEQRKLKLLDRWNQQDRDDAEEQLEQWKKENPRQEQDTPRCGRLKAIQASQGILGTSFAETQMVEAGCLVIHQ